MIDLQKQLDGIRQRYINGLNKGQRILFRIATGDDASYDSEYDGINDSYCRYCDANLSRGDHHEECDIFEARKALGKGWTNFENALQQAKDDYNKEQERIAEEKRKLREKVPCPKCGQKVTRIGMKDHQKSKACARRIEKNELRAHEERTGIKCITDIDVNYDGPRCKQCNKAMPGAHPNKKFCSNSGHNNCKDRFHNRQPHRVERSRAFIERNPHKAKRRKLTDAETAALITAAWREGAEGWDEHKDSF